MSEYTPSVITAQYPPPATGFAEFDAIYGQRGAPHEPHISLRQQYEESFGGRRSNQLDSLQQTAGIVGSVLRAYMHLSTDGGIYWPMPTGREPLLADVQQTTTTVLTRWQQVHVRERGVTPFRDLPSGNVTAEDLMRPDTRRVIALAGAIRDVLDYAGSPSQMRMLAVEGLVTVHGPMFAAQWLNGEFVPEHVRDTRKVNAATLREIAVRNPANVLAEAITWQQQPERSTAAYTRLVTAEHPPAHKGFESFDALYGQRGTPFERPTSIEDLYPGVSMGGRPPELRPRQQTVAAIQAILQAYRSSGAGNRSLWPEPHDLGAFSLELLESITFAVFDLWERVHVRSGGINPFRDMPVEGIRTEDLDRPDVQRIIALAGAIRDVARHVSPTSGAGMQAIGRLVTRHGPEFAAQWLSGVYTDWRGEPISVGQLRQLGSTSSIKVAQLVEEWRRHQTPGA